MHSLWCLTMLSLTSGAELDYRHCEDSMLFLILANASDYLVKSTAGDGLETMAPMAASTGKMAQMLRSNESSAKLTLPHNERS